jgi:uncharacterized protein YybS (DUF2232 family)
MVDIRIPIGLMFSLLGIIISILGFTTISNPTMYNKSLGININIIMGILMLVFGLVMLFFAFKKKKK